MWYSRLTPKVQFDIREAPRRNPDGSYADYGVWSVVAKFKDDPLALGHGWFAASADRDASGAAVLRFRDNEVADWEEKGILVTTGARGSGWIVIPEGGGCSCAGTDCACTLPTTPETVYAYDPDTLTIHKESAAPRTKSRNDAVDYPRRLAIFDAETGAEAGAGVPYALSLRRPGVTERPLMNAWAFADGARAVVELVPGEKLALRNPPAGAASPEFTVSPTISGRLSRTDLIPATVEDAVGSRYSTWECSAGFPCRARVYVFTAQGWFEKTVLSMDEQGGHVVFDPAGDVPVEVAIGERWQASRDVTSFEVTRTGIETWDVRRTVWDRANPSNADDIVPDGLALEHEGCGLGCPTYRFDSDPASPTFLKLVYATLPPLDQYAALREGDVVASYVALQLHGAGSVQYNLEWNPTETAHFLMLGNEYVTFMGPLRFDAIPLRNHAGVVRRHFVEAQGTYAEPPDAGLVLTGVHQNDGHMTPEVAAEVVSIPNGTELVESGSGRRFLVKVLYVDQYLLPSAAAPLDLTEAEALRNSELTRYVEPEPAMGDIPDLTVAPLADLAAR